VAYERMRSLLLPINFAALLVGYGDRLFARSEIRDYGQNPVLRERRVAAQPER